jgi:hypothetical protein
MKSNAAGQLLGYTLQYPRGLYHLLTGGPGDLVCIEELGDVATLKPNSDVIAEEDKSSIVENPLTDKSTDLWKTFSNWINLIDVQNLDVTKMKFVLYCNNSGREGIVNLFNTAHNSHDAQSAINDAKNKLGNLSHDHEIWKYYNHVVNQNESLLLNIIEKFELQIGDGAGHEEVRNELLRQHVHENTIDDLMCTLNGWLQIQVTEKIANHEQAIISWDEFNKKFLVFIERIRCFELVDFASIIPHSNEEIETQIKIRPIYLQQLEIIDISGDEIIEAVSNYLKADVNRGKWIDSGIIDEMIASEFESRLKSYWNNQRKRIQLTRNDLSEIEKGQLLLFDCKIRDEKIRDMTPPHPTIAGTYHALADEKSLGWHPDWENSC